MVMMAPALGLCLLMSSANRQVINGIKPVDDGTRQYARAYVKQLGEVPTLARKPDPFMAGYFSLRAKVLAPLMHTKYTAAHLGMCGTLLGLYEPDAGPAIKAGTDRIVKGTKDFDSLTSEEVEGITKALGKFSPYADKLPGLSDEAGRPFLIGARVGMLGARVTVWHISPKQKILLTDISDAIKGCVEAGAKLDGQNADLASALKGLGPFVGKELEEATVRAIGKQVETILRASLPETYRWNLMP